VVAGLDGHSFSLHAHFVLLAPASWLVENAQGDPRLAPCGSAPPPPPTHRYRSATRGEGDWGSKLHLKVQETIYHPGHYRVRGLNPCACIRRTIRWVRA
jgi:hypothetical protein